MKKNNKGFTLMEMLIVVAIIAVLIAIAIPTFSGSLTKARQAADNANVRAAYAEAMSKALSNNETATATAGPMQAAYDGSSKIGDVQPTTWAKGATVTVTVTPSDDGFNVSIGGPSTPEPTPTTQPEG